MLTENLDISILAADKVLKNDSSISEFLQSTVSVYQKTDGVKLTVVKIGNTGTLEDYVFAYKGSILYNEEYGYEPEHSVKKTSIGTSQFGLVFKHFSKLGKNAIPVGTELAIEFLMKKPTLSSNYEKPHGLVLIGYSKTEYDVRFGKFKSIPGKFETEKRTTYASMLNIDTPVKLFYGKLGDIKSFESGITNELLKSKFEKIKFTMHWDNQERLIKDISELFLDIESAYGGKEEGVVIEYDDKIIKFQQSYQLDQSARREIKAKIKGSDEQESEYWKNVNEVSKKIASKIGNSGSLKDLLKKLSSELSSIKLEFSHPKKTTLNIKDDIQLSAKTLIIKSLPGNNGCLILGKFRVLTKTGHVKLIESALSKFDSVVICLVSGKDSQDTRELRLKALNILYENNKKVKIIEANSGNVSTIIAKSPVNINSVYAGSDRIETYAKQLKTIQGTEIVELERNDSDISASKVIDNLSDFEFFKKSVPIKLCKLYQEYVNAYGDSK